MGMLSSPPILLRVLVLTALFSAAAVYESGQLWSLKTPEIWIHLRTGSWILENHAIPRSGLFSQSPNLAWNDSTWGFDLLVGVGYRLFGLWAIPILSMVLKVSFAVMTFLLARSGRLTFWGAVLLSAIAQFVIWGLQPLPYVFSILFFAIEIQLLLRSRRNGSSRSLFLLPFLFAIWANLHVQFVAGLLLLLLFTISVAVEQRLRRIGVGWLSSRIVSLAPGQTSVVTILSAIATLATPYGFHVLPGALQAIYGDVAFEHFAEMSSMGFRRPQEFVLMLLVMMAFLALGRLRSLELFELLMLLAGTAVAFRIQRDGWMVVLPAIAVLGRGFVAERHQRQGSPEKRFSWERTGIAGLTALALLIVAFRLPSRDALTRRMSQDFPVKACDYIVGNKLAPPLFNAYSWGSFVTWYMPQYPVLVDSRVEMYGEDFVAKYFDVVGGKGRLEDAPLFTHAGALLLERNSAIAKALTDLPGLKSQYRLVYSDEIASVFVPMNSER